MTIVIPDTVPLGAHLTQVAARLILSNTNVGFHLPSSQGVQTYALRSWKNIFH